MVKRINGISVFSSDLVTLEAAECITDAVSKNVMVIAW